jgi:SAM-dependent methyltransferase
MIRTALQGPLQLAVAFGHRLAVEARGEQIADRALLEHKILPLYAARGDIQRLLFVGCARYTEHYDRIVARVEYWTIDPARWRRRWGAQRHIVDRLERLSRHVPGEYFDAIVCNGVLGWGLDRPSDAEEAFAACHQALRPAGELIVGWNDVAPRNRVRPDAVRALARFDRHSPRGFDHWRIAVPGPHRHVFDFYRRPAGG